MEKTITMSVSEYNELVDKAQLNEQIIIDAIKKYAQELEEENTELKLRAGLHPMGDKIAIKYFTRCAHGLKSMLRNHVMKFKKVKE